MKILAHVIAITSILGLITFSRAASYDLNAAWSTNSNPNGVWSLNQGGSPLPFISDWQPGSFSAPQTAWAPNGSVDPYLPAWMKVSSSNLFGNTDFRIGDVIVHTSDNANGAGEGTANVMWTSPGVGIANISGNVWAARNIGRGNHWNLYVNGSLVSGGDIPEDGTYTRVNPFDLGSGSGGSTVLTNIAVFAGEVIELELVKTGDLGDFVGVNFAVSTSELRIVAITRQSDDILVTWTTTGGQTNFVQATAGAAGGSYSNNFTDLSPLIAIPGIGLVTTNYLELGAATNMPSRYYRIRSPQ